MAGVPGVKGVHDLHIWTITSGLHATLQIVEEQSDRVQVE
jgi:Co/Zn/Cd efflux system component